MVSGASIARVSRDARATVALGAWIAGIAVAYAGPSLDGGGADTWPLPSRWLALALLVLSVSAMARVVGVTRAAAVALVIGLLALGLARGAAAVHHPGPATIDGYIGETARVQGVVESVSAPLSGAGGSTASQQQRFRLAADQLTARGGARSVEGLVLVQAHSQAEVWPGQRLSLSGRLTRLRRLGPGGVAGYAERVERQGVEAEMSAGSLVALTPPPTLSIPRAVEAMRQGLARSCRDVLPEPEATIVLGEVAGIRGRLPAAVDADLVDSGLVHVLAISGIKVAIVAGMLQLLAVAIAGRRAVVGAIGGIALYTLVGGASASAVRSALMGSLALFARSLRRDPEVLRSLLLAAGLMLAWRPSLVSDLSFQYSFLGVLGIHLFAEAAAQRLGRVPSPFREALAVTAAAQLATLPLTANYFQVVPLLAPVANALVLPTLPASIACGLVLGFAGALGRASAAVSAPAFAIVSGLVTALEIPLATLALWLARLAIGVAHVVAHLPGAVLRAPSFGAAPTSAYYAGLVAAMATMGGARRWRVPAAFAAAACVGIVVLLAMGRSDGRLHVTFLTAGGGPAALIVAPDGATMLVDTGSQAAALSAALDGALPAVVPAPGRRRIDAVLLTGGSRAEAGGLAALDAFRVGLVIAPEHLTGSAATASIAAAARRGAVVTATNPGDRLRWHGLDLLVSSATSATQSVTIDYGGRRTVIVEGAGREPSLIPPGDYAVVGVGEGATDPLMDGVRAGVVIAQDTGGKPIARGLRLAYPDALWQSSRDGRLDVTCDARRCWW